VVLKADIRESTTLTRTLLEKGLNPASYFSLNFLRSHQQASAQV